MFLAAKRIHEFLLAVRKRDLIRSGLSTVTNLVPTDNSKWRALSVHEFWLKAFLSSCSVSHPTRPFFLCQRSPIEDAVAD